MTEEVEQIGVKHEQIVINAATPDVLAAVCKKITDSVMELIPKDAISTIAQRVIDQGVIVTVHRSSYGSNKVDTATIKEKAQQAVSVLLDRQVSKIVGELWASESTQEFVRKASIDGFAHAMESVPAAVGAMLVSRMSNAWAPPQNVNISVAGNQVKDNQQLTDDIASLKQDLMAQTNLNITDTI